MKAIRLAVLLCAALSVAACLPVTTKNPIGTTAGFKADPALLGMWKGRGEDSDAREGYFAFLRNADGAMTVILVTPENDGDEWSTFDLRTATLGGNRIMNVRGGLKDGKPNDDELSKENIPLLYTLAGGKLTLSLLDEKAVAAAIKSGKIDGTVDAGGTGDAHITADPAKLDAFFATREGAALFGAKLVTLTKMN